MTSKVGIMKQSTLAFGNQSSRAVEVVDLVSSSDEDHKQFKRSSKPTGKQLFLSDGDLISSADQSNETTPIAEENRENMQATAQASGKGYGKKVRAEKDLLTFCHHHKSRCKDTLLHCTVLKPNGSRCQIRYCANSLEKIYGQSIGYILTRGFDEQFTLGKKHASEIDYVWTCPSCEGICECSMCRMKENSGSSSVLGKHQRDLRAVSGKISSEKTGRSSTSTYDQGNSHNKIMQSTIWNGFSRAAQQNQHLPYERERNAVVEIVFSPSKKRRQLPPLIEPVRIEAPLLKRIETELPVPNIKERIWIYESLVRFDAIHMPKKSILQKLECFDDWTEQMVHGMLVQIACYLAEIKHFKQTPQAPHTSFRALIKVLREADKDLTSGEVWKKAQELLEMKEVQIPKLEDVDLHPHQRASTADTSFSNDTNTNGAASPIETLLHSRASRQRRAANTAAQQKVKTITQANLEESDDDDDDDDDDDGESASVISTNTNNEDAGRNLRKSSRNAAKKRSEDDELSTRGAVRKAFGLRDRSKGGHAIGETETRASKKTIEESEDDGLEVFNSAKENDSSGENDDIESVIVIDDEPKDERIPLPPFEQRIAILSGMIELVLQREEIRKEVEEGARLVRERIRESKEEERELRKEQDEELRELKKRQMDMHRIGKTQEWKDEMEKMTRDHLISVIDIHIALHNFIDANKPRSGPLGKDVDGNEYWHLSEFNETLPTDTAGHWAWSLLVIGTAETIPMRKGQLEFLLNPESPQKDGTEQSLGESSNSNIVEQDKPLVYNTNEVDEIERLIRYVRYRQDLKCYEKEKDLFEKEEMALKAMEEAESKRLKKICSHERKALVSFQETQLKNTEQLQEKLRTIKEYYQWHRWVN